MIGCYYLYRRMMIDFRHRHGYTVSLYIHVLYELLGTTKL